MTEPFCLFLADSGYEFDDGRGSQAKYQPRTESGQFRKRHQDEEEDSYQETGRGQNKQKRRRGSDNEGWDDQNDQQEDRRGWNAKVQPRTESGQFKKTRDNGDGNESGKLSCYVVGMVGAILGVIGFQVLLVAEISFYRLYVYATLMFQITVDNWDAHVVAGPRSNMTKTI